ncbi:hypothetical protein LOTGIDRAFT_135052, partial [Lottia gigantea]
FSVFRQGDIGTNWYTVLSGSLEVTVSETGKKQDAVTLCILGPGTSFGESILTNKPRHATVVTRDYTELIRVEQKDFKILWERNKQLMERVLTPLSALQKLGRFSYYTPTSLYVRQHLRAPSQRLARAGRILRTMLLCRAPHMIRDRKLHLRTYRRCLVGSEMVDWLMQQSTLVHQRNQAVGMWQALLEEGVIVHVCREHQFKDKYLFYRFEDDDEGIGTVPTNIEKKEAEDRLPDTVLMLATIGPDAMMRMILRKQPTERTSEDLEIVYEELLHIKALSHLSTMVKRELASVLIFESHAEAGTVLFNQGDVGKSWYIILKGSVNVVIYGKGIVCTLHEGDDFGKLALVNDAPRAATIVLREDNCHFLRVDKEDFNRILRDVEANTVRLKEHGQDVLVLEKIPTNVKSQDGSVQSHYKYSVMAGTPEKMLEHLLETRLDNKQDENSGRAIISSFKTFQILLDIANATVLQNTLIVHCMVLPVFISPIKRRRVVRKTSEFKGLRVYHGFFYLHSVFKGLIKSLLVKGKNRDSGILKYSVMAGTPEKMLEHLLETRLDNKQDENSGRAIISSFKTFQILLDIVQSTIQSIVKVYCADHTYSSFRFPMNTSVAEIVHHAKDKLSLGDDLILCEVKSNGDRMVFKDNNLCVTTGLSLNGRLFITPREHIDALTPLQEQDGPSESTANSIELMSTKELAYQITLYDWELFNALHEFELIYLVFGRHRFNKITANLDLFLRRFNEIQYWVATEMVLCSNVSKRVQLLKKFIKLAAICKENKNLHSFFAIVMGLSNIAVSRLSQTWEKLPGKFNKLFAEFETVMDPSRNHRVYRLTVAKMNPPILPFMPLLMKGEYC